MFEKMFTIETKFHPKMFRTITEEHNSMATCLQRHLLLWVRFAARVLQTESRVCQRNERALPPTTDWKGRVKPVRGLKTANGKVPSFQNMRNDRRSFYQVAIISAKQRCLMRIHTRERSKWINYTVELIHSLVIVVVYMMKNFVFIVFQYFIDWSS